MEIIRGAKYRLYPSAKQKSLLHNLFGLTRFTYNLFLSKIKESYFGTSLNKKTGELVPKIPSEFDLSKALTIFKSEYHFLYSVPNMFLQAESKKLSSAYSKFFSGGGYPKFKSKKDKYQSLSCYRGSRFDHEYIYIPKAQGTQFKKEDFKIKYKNHKTNFFPRDKITGYTISKDNLDKYWISFNFKTESRKFKKKRKSIGIDLGINDFIILSDGTKYPNDNLLKRAQDKLKRKQRELSRKKRGSSNYKKCNIKLSKLHRKVQNQRQHRNHSISKKLIDVYDFIGLESLSVLQMMLKEYKNCKGMKGLRNSISNASWFDFSSKLKYKIAESQGHLVQIDRYFPSTKLCFNCGNVRNVDLSERVYTCECGYQEDRDINAAKNILVEAKRLASL